MPKTFDELFPPPINAQYFLWAGHWDQIEEGDDMDAMLWSHPGHEVEEDPKDAVYTTEQAMQIHLDCVGLLLVGAAVNAGTEGGAVKLDIVEEMARSYRKYMIDNVPEVRDAFVLDSRIEEAMKAGILPPQSPAPSFTTTDARQLELY